MMDYFKGITDLLNYRHIEESDRPNLSEFEQYLVDNVFSISFFDSVIVITKNSPDLLPKKRAFVGNKELVTTGVMEMSTRENWRLE